MWRLRGGGVLDGAVQAEVGRVSAVLVSDHLDYCWGVARALQGVLSEDFVDVPLEHPRHDADSEQQFAPAPPSVTVQGQTAT